MAWSDYFLPSGAMTADEQQANYERLQAEGRRRAALGLTTGSLTREEAVQYLSSPAMSGLEDQDAAAWQGAKEGAAEGLNNVLDAPGRVVGAVGDAASQVTGGVLKNIPFWIYLGTAAALFIWMGGLSLLKGKLKS